ncbi:MAG: damage-control phosphatase ARMT1 family protein [Desulfobacca sp.]|uniref:damage-control phosphatase ARMT1 family protein n=1 Tax=Desulfobacca sp. TaxID=2067990 RepID=UPI00404AE4C0
MTAMSIRQECQPCLLQLIEQTVAAATADPTRQAVARRRAQAILTAEFSPQAIPARIANRIHPVIKEVTGNPDPCRARKERETAMARRLAARLAAPPPPDPHTLLAWAAAGNALDFFRPESDISRDMISPAVFTASDLDAWWTRLQASPGLLLYLADNAGEQFFDLPLVLHLRDLGWQVYYVVKGGPIQNDLTRADLTASGLAAALAPVVDTGAATVGLELESASREFQGLFQQADLILAKGMGHYETLAHLPDPRLFFLLQAKCAPVAASLRVPHRSFVLRLAGGRE